MKKSIVFITFFLAISFSLAQTPSVDVNLIRQLIEVLQKLVQGSGAQPVQPLTLIPFSQAISPLLPRGVQPAIPETKPITPEGLRSILPDQDRENDVIVQLNNLRITRIATSTPDTRAVFFAVRDTGWRCMMYESEESTQALPCVLDIRKHILQKELAIKIVNDTILLLRNRQRAKLSDFQVGDKINVYGFMDKDNFGIEASIIRKIASAPTLPPSPPKTSDVRVISPNDGEVWPLGSEQEIKWSAFGNQTVTIYLRKYIACFYQEPRCLMPEPRPYVIAEKVTNTGVYKWQVGDVKDIRNIDVGQYLIEIVGDQTNQSDTSDMPFNIVSLKSIPNSISGYLTKTEVSIYMWGTHQLKGDDGKVYQVKAINDEVKSLLDEYSGKRVKIYGKVEYQTIEGGFWTIIAEKVELLSVPTMPEVRIISPNGGEKWIFGTDQEIKWFANQDKTVSIYLKEYISCLYEEPKCLIPEPKSYPIVENFGNKGSYLWQVGELQNKLLINSGEYFVIVTGNQSLKSDQSDKPFKIEVSTAQSSLTKEIIGYLTKIDVPDNLLWTHLLIGDDGKIYPVKGENSEVAALLDKNLNKKVKISGTIEYKTFERSFWLIIASKVEALD